MHHARVEYRVVHPEDDTNQVFVYCPECNSEWGWQYDVKGATADLYEMAGDHNEGFSSRR